MIKRTDRQLFVVFVFAALFLSSIISAIASGIDGVPDGRSVLLVWPLLTLALLLVVWAARGTERLTGKLLPGLRLGLVAGLLAFATVAVAHAFDDHKRCVDKQTMTVVPAADCQNPGNQGSTGTEVWYYGGTGTRVGSPAEDGSLTPPEENSGGGTSGDTGDDGGDDGDG